MLESRHIKAVDAIHRCRTFTQAAASLNISTSALSKQMRELEDSLGKSLVDRKTKRLTEFGEYLLEQGSMAVKALVSAEETIKSLHSIFANEVVVAAPMPFAKVMTLAAQHVMKGSPDLHLRIDSLEPAAAVAEFNTGAINVLIGYPEMLGELVVAHSVAPFPFPAISFIMAKDHPLNTKKASTPKQFAKYPRVGPRLPAFLEEYFTANFRIDNVEVQDGYRQTSPIYHVTTNDWTLCEHMIKTEQAVSGGLADDMHALVKNYPKALAHCRVNFSVPYPTDKQCFIAWDTDSPQVSTFIDHASKQLRNLTHLGQPFSKPKPAT